MGKKNHLKKEGKIERGKKSNYHHPPREVSDGPSALAVASTAILPSVADADADAPSPEDVPDEVDGAAPVAAVPVERDGLLDEAEPGAEPDAVHLPEQRGDVGDVPAAAHEALDPPAGDGGHELHGLPVDAVGAAEPVEHLERAVGVAALLREVDEHQLQLPRGQRRELRRRRRRGVLPFPRERRLPLEVLDGGGEQPAAAAAIEAQLGGGVGDDAVEAQGARGRGWRAEGDAGARGGEGDVGEGGGAGGEGHGGGGGLGWSELGMGLGGHWDWGIWGGLGEAERERRGGEAETWAKARGRGEGGRNE